MRLKINGKLMRLGLLLFVIGFLFPACGQSNFTILDAKLFFFNQGLKWKSIDPSLRAKLQPFYDFDLSKVRYVENVDMNLAFDALTYRYRIYFKGKAKFRLLAHELEHVSQFVKNPLFYERYLLSTLAALKIQKNSTVRTIHGSNNYEKEASKKAQSLPYMTNSFK